VPLDGCTLLIVDDDRELTVLLGELLPQEGFDVEIHNNGAGRRG
jgi:DNA-binding response OmpR family regulator